MSEPNVLITGTPRSGTTLTCHLLNRVPNTVALHEPMRVREFAKIGNREEICRSIESFFNGQRASIREHRRAISKHVDGAVPDNSHGTDQSDAGLRQKVVSLGEITVDKELAPDFMLVMKHVLAFAAILEEAILHFPVYAVVRNPLATLASWNSIDFDSRRGRAPVAELLDPALAARLASIDDQLERQIYLLGWFHEQFHRHLPQQSIIRYESIIASGGSALAVVRPTAATLREPLQSRNTNPLYDRETVVRIGERLLASEGPYWESYSRRSVERLLAEFASEKATELEINEAASDRRASLAMRARESSAIGKR